MNFTPTPSTIKKFKLLLSTENAYLKMLMHTDFNWASLGRSEIKTCNHKLITIRRKAIDRQEWENSDRQGKRPASLDYKDYLKVAFNISEKYVLEPICAGKERETTSYNKLVKQIVDRTNELKQEKNEHDDFKFKELATLPKLEESDFLNEDSSREEMLRFLVKLGFVIRSDDEYVPTEENYIWESSKLTPDIQLAVNEIERYDLLYPRAGKYHYIDKEKANKLLKGDAKSPKNLGIEGVYALYFKHLTSAREVFYIKATLRIAAIVATTVDDVVKIRIKLNLPDINYEYDLQSDSTLANHAIDTEDAVIAGRESNEYNKNKLDDVEIFVEEDAETKLNDNKIIEDCFFSAVPRFQYRGFIKPTNEDSHLSAVLYYDIDNIEEPEGNHRIADEVYLILTNLSGKYEESTGMLTSINQQVATNIHPSPIQAYSSSCVVCKQHFNDLKNDKTKQESAFMVGEPRSFKSLSEFRDYDDETQLVAKLYFDIWNKLEPISGCMVEDIKERNIEDFRRKQALLD